MMATRNRRTQQSSYSKHRRLYSEVAGTYTPAQDVEALGHGVVEGEGNGAEGDAEAHHAAGAVRVLQRELVRRHGAEVLAHQERLRARTFEWTTHRIDQYYTVTAKFSHPIRFLLLPLGRRARRGWRARRRRGRPRPRSPPRSPAAGRTGRTRGSPARRRGTPRRPRPASGGAKSTISPGSRAGTPPCPGHLLPRIKRAKNGDAASMRVMEHGRICSQRSRSRRTEERGLRTRSHLCRPERRGG